ncbi:MAG: glycosyltransferase, partial [Thermodesulfobacteriota bacterium]|nr:glycosyltransferase [Thermodesulfobacteriota bacterium]
MDFLLLGSNYFQKSLIRQGHGVIWAGDHPDCDLCLPLSRLDLPHILAKLSFSPQAVILTDDLGRRVWPTGLEKTSALKVWYAVDGPINYFWQKHYAPLFDLVLADQKDCAERLGRLYSSKVHWLPVGVDTKIYAGPPEKKTHDLGFVGVVNGKVRPKRSRIINLLKHRYRLCASGGRRDEWVSPKEAALLYRRSRLVLNENLFDGVTTRIFEAMASGTMLLTEAGGNGLTDLFIPGEDLACYGPENLIELTDFYLADEEERERVAARGRDKVLA